MSLLPVPSRGPRRGRARPAVAALGLVAVLVSGVAAPSGAARGAERPEAGPAPAAPDPAGPEAPDGEAPPGDEPPPLGPLPVIAPELAGVPVRGAAHDAAVALRDRLERERAEAEELEVRKGGEVIELTGRDQDLTARIAWARGEAEHWEAEEARLGEALRELAIATYVSGTGREMSPLLQLDADQHDALATLEVTAGSLAHRQITDLTHARATARARRDEQRAATAERDEVRTALEAAQTAREAARTDKERLAGALWDAATRVEEERRLALVAGSDLPLVVLDAYWKASRLLGLLHPECGIPWWALAGIGKVESRHGTFGGSEVRADGTLTRPIIGIPLTGAGGTAHIPDSDGGLVDGDATYDRAAGPMQFIPQTWARWGRDGDGDGDIDVQSLYDAAAGAAAYLCASGPLHDDDGLARAFFSYNHSDLYVLAVLTEARGYEASVELPSAS